MVIASIDLMNGKVVQLKQGREKIIERENPYLLAREFDRYGETAVIDLDAAMNQGDNSQIIKEILKICECRAGGGIRSLERAHELISLGAKKVIIGSKAFEDNCINHSFLDCLVQKIGRSRVVIAIDALNGEIVTQGWKHRTGLNLFNNITKLENYAGEFLFTCVEKEGTLEGIDKGMVKKLAALTKNRITVAGGVNSIEEIRELSQIGVDVQIGMALYTGRITLSDAFIESLNWKEELLPVITQDDAGQVLTLAHANKESLRKTFETGRMWYFSRSRNRLWMKGETSDNTQELVKIRADCDRDTLLATVKQRGAACHQDTYSCFGERKFNLYQLYEIVKERIENPKPESYTSKLTDKMLKEKIEEEAKEISAAKLTSEIIWEAADLLYFISVLLAKNNVTLDDVLYELRRRRMSKGTTSNESH